MLYVVISVVVRDLSEQQLIPFYSGLDNIREDFDFFRRNAVIKYSDKYVM